MLNKRSGCEYQTIQKELTEKKTLVYDSERSSCITWDVGVEVKDFTSGSVTTHSMYQPDIQIPECVTVNYMNSSQTHTESSYQEASDEVEESVILTLMFLILLLLIPLAMVLEG